jgi:DNA-binding ferritin-like protein (Dps family)
MSRRSKSASRQMVECLQDQLVEYFEENVFDDCDYADLTGSDLLEAFVGAFREIESEMQKKLNPVQFMLEKLDPEKD